jgi:tetratricopeptide (TPR) repeat protein
VVAHAWLALGEIEFEAGDRASLDRAVVAYARAAREPTLAPVATYKRAWSLYRADRHAEAIAAFEPLLGDTREDLRTEARQYLAVIAADPDWDVDGRDDARRGLDRPEVAALVDGSPHAAELLRELADVLLAEVRCDEARAVTAALATRDPDAARDLEPRFAACTPSR